MKKIIFVDMPMRKMDDTANRQCYAGTGNADCRYTGKVVFPVNAVLAEKLQKGDQVKAVLLTTITGKDHSIENAELFQQELNSINAAIGAHIEYERLTTDFYPSPTGEYFIASVKHEKQSKRLLYYKKK